MGPSSETGSKKCRIMRCAVRAPSCATSASGRVRCAAAASRSGLIDTSPRASSSAPKISACRAPLASARLNCDFMLPGPSLPAACSSTDRPAARSASAVAVASGSAAASGSTT